jgi:serine-type D-Ala-D-Ala carboxypeptidase (penicillin-binding protein 5/6)
MSCSEPARTASRQTRATVYGRRRVLLGAVFAVLLALAVLPGSQHELNGTPPEKPQGRGSGGTFASAVRWPPQGQGALVLGDGRPAVSPDEQPAPIASVAKVMTAFLVLKHYPLSGVQGGFAITVTAAQMQAEAHDASEGESVVAVRAGEQLNERQLLDALLIPSGNNIAEMLAALVAGSETRFLAEMNAEARVLGMDHTIYTDPSGFDPSTLSTAADQLHVFQQAMRFPVFREIIATASVTLPVAGTVTNFNPLIDEGYAGKTGSDAEAGGCLAFFTHVTVSGRQLVAIGVVMGQGHGNDTSTLLAAAGEAAQQLVQSVAPTTSLPTRSALGPGAPGTPGGRIAPRALGGPSELS